MKALVQFVCAVTGRRRLVFGLPDRLAHLQAWLLEHLPGKLMTRDNLRSMQVPSTCSAPFPFRLHPQSLEAVAPGYLAPAGPRERYPQLRWRARR
jgi:NADH dehydrogenase